ncbi:uncharacterized protein LOC114274823 [Camellia sinensis]|uniref:uncharacterized protein LOC114274823 n=1 Tax=Camellia sinensis TaxID=4442 RepID=UPI001036F021|nr:uncharacterized protein LOC114274823 [Camellia sinensis]
MAALKAKQLCNRVQTVKVAEQPALEDVGGAPEEKIVEDLEKVLVKEDDPEKYFLIGDTLLGADEKLQLLELLRKNKEVFAWSTYDTPGLNPEFACHKLNINHSVRPVVQKSRRSSVEHTEAVIAKVEKLLASGAIRKVHFLLPRIDQLVDSTAGHERMSFLDAYSGYHQIPLFGLDQEMTTFITPRGTYCYKVMSFDLKNAGATYQRMITRMFRDQLGKTMEAYIDDMVVKSKLATNHLANLREVFGILKNHQFCLNASKCTFRVGTGKFLGYMVTHRGIEVNPDQIKAIQGLEAPTKAKELQKLAGMVAALNRFISKSSDRMKPFFQLLRKRLVFEWSSECTEALQSLKRYLSTPPLLSTPEPREELYLYLVVSDHAVSAVLIREVNKEQRPVYYVNKILLDAETRTAIKAQVLADFVVEFAPTQSTEPGNPSSAQALRLGWKASNNEAEYKALLVGLRSAEHFSAEQLLVFSDSQLVVNQLSGVYKTRDERIAVYAGKAKDLLKKFQSIRVERISQDKNSHADALVCLGSSVDTKDARKVWVEFVPEPSIASPVLCSNLEPSWMDPILAFLKSGTLPKDKKEANKVRHRSARFWISSSGKLYKRSYLSPYLLCVHPNLIENVLYEIHDGICGCHVGGRWFFIAATNYFTKWVEVEALASINEVDKKRFVMRNVVVRFGIPRVLIADNGTQFDGNIFRKFCVDFRIEYQNSSPGYPQSNGQAEALNKTIINEVKKRLEHAKGKWIEELPYILWAYRTTARCSTGETPYSLTYGMEAIIPLEVGLPILRSELFESTSNEEAIAQVLDMAEGRREVALIRLVAYQQQLIKSFNQKVFPRKFTLGELVLRKVMDHKRVSGEGKLGPNWEGLYKVAIAAGNRAYYLEDLKGRAIPRPWNVANLKKYYQ